MTIPCDLLHCSLARSLQQTQTLFTCSLSPPYSHPLISLLPFPHLSICASPSAWSSICLHSSILWVSQSFSSASLSLLLLLSAYWCPGSLSLTMPDLSTSRFQFLLGWVLWWFIMESCALSVTHIEHPVSSGMMNLVSRRETVTCTVRQRGLDIMNSKTHRRVRLVKVKKGSGFKRDLPVLHTKILTYQNLFLRYSHHLRSLRKKKSFWHHQRRSKHITAIKNNRQILKRLTAVLHSDL